MAIRDPEYEYNKEPVHYCERCMSLNVTGPETMEFCDDCGSTNIDAVSIFEWEEKYKSMYKHYFLEYY